MKRIIEFLDGFIAISAFVFLAAFAELPYRKAIRLKRDKARILRDILYRQIHDTKAPYSEIYELLERHYAVSKAVKHNEALIEELEGVER